MTGLMAPVVLRAALTTLFHRSISRTANSNLGKLRWGRSEKGVEINLCTLEFYLESS